MTANSSIFSGKKNRSSGPVLAALILTAFIPVFASCSRNAERQAGGAAQTGDGTFPLSLVDGLGRELVLEAKPERIVSLSPSLTEILFAAGAGDQVVGVTEFCDHPPEAQTRVIVGGFSGNSVSIEKVAELRPDLVVVSADMHQRTVEVLTRLGIKSFAVEPRTFEDVFAAMTALGNITGNARGAQAIIAEMREKIDRAGARRGSRPRPRVYWELSYDPIMTTGRDTWVNDAISIGGGDNVFGDVPGQYPTVGLEQIILKEPEWILVAEYGAMGISAEAIKTRAGWTRIPAVARGNIGVVDADSLYRYGPRLADAALRISEILFGD